MSLPTVNKSEKTEKTLTLLILCVLVPAVVLIGALVFRLRSYAWISLCVVVLSIVPFLCALKKAISMSNGLSSLQPCRAFRRWQNGVRRRSRFQTRCRARHNNRRSLRRRSGFMVGALSALLSNFTSDRDRGHRSRCSTGVLSDLSQGFLPPC